MGVVPQDTVLFNETVRYNIAYGRAGTATAAGSEQHQQHGLTTSSSTAAVEPPKLEELVGRDEIERAARSRS